MSRMLRLSIVGLAGLGFAACGATDPGSRVASVIVSPDALTVLVGVSQPLTAIARNQDGNPLEGRSVVWTSSDPTISTVSGTGVVAGVRPGSATITATSDGKSGSAAVSVITLALASVVAGGAHTCGITTSGAAYCWGRGEAGQLGIVPPSTTCLFETGSLPCIAVPVAVQGGLTFTQIVAGGTHTCALTSDGSAYCWGLNSTGQLGDNSTTARFAPVAVATSLKFTSLSGGAGHTCGLTSDGAAYCWGSNGLGQLGDGTTTNRSAPVAVSGSLRFQMITAGGYSVGQTCAITTIGDAYCWGDNGFGQLGIGPTPAAPHPAPALVTGGLKWATISTGLGQHTCGITTAGAAYCWGINTFGALGDGTTTQRPDPVQVIGGITFAQITAGGFIGHSCGLTSSGKAYCWGENEVGAIGNGTTADNLTPSAVAGELTFTSLDAGYRHTCGRATTGIVYCWGSGRAGQVGTNSLSVFTVPAKVIGQP